MTTVKLDEEEWQKVLGIISTAPWNIANPLLMKIGEQLRLQQGGNVQEMAGNKGQVGVKHIS